MTLSTAMQYNATIATQHIAMQFNKMIHCQLQENASTMQSIAGRAVTISIVMQCPRATLENIGFGSPLDKASL